MKLLLPREGEIFQAYLWELADHNTRDSPAAALMGLGLLKNRAVSVYKQGLAVAEGLGCTFHQLLRGTTLCDDVLWKDADAAEDPEKWLKWDKPLRFCARCRDEDRANGAVYWRREHQIFGVFWCVKHGCALSAAYPANAIRRSPEHLCFLPLAREEAQHGWPTDVMKRFGLNARALLVRKSASFSLRELSRYLGSRMVLPERTHGSWVVQLTRGWHALLCRGSHGLCAAPEFERVEFDRYEFHDAYGLYGHSDECGGMTSLERAAFSLAVVGVGPAELAALASTLS